MRFAVVVLAGGEGSRLGGGKPLKMLGGKRLIDHAEALACQWSGIVAVAVRSPAQVGRTRFVRIIDEPAIDGPLAGLAAALRFARNNSCEVVLTIPVDMPFLPSDLGDRLSAAIDGHSAALAGLGGRLHPVCGIWRVTVLKALPDYLASGRRSLRGFAETTGFREVEWPTAPSDPFFNINSADDLNFAERMLET